MKKWASILDYWKRESEFELLVANWLRSLIVREGFGESEVRGIERGGQMPVVVLCDGDLLERPEILMELIRNIDNTVSIVTGEEKLAERLKASRKDDPQEREVVRGYLGVEAMRRHQEENLLPTLSEFGTTLESSLWHEWERE